MLRQPLALRFTTALVAGSLLAGPMLPATAMAQPSDPAISAAPPAPDAAAATDQPDPPARVGRLARVRGTVSYHPGSAESWDRAQANWPLTTGDAIWTEPDGRTELELAGGVIQLQGGSELSIDRLDDRSLGATLRQGEVRLRLSRLAPGESLRVQTPRGLVTISTPGRYDIVAGDVESPTRVTVFEGSAEIGDRMRLGARQVALVSGADPFTTATEAAGADPFRSMAPLPPVRAARTAPVPRAVEQMPGGGELAAYGEWEPTPEYGAVWYPQVASGWTPYRNGHWAFVAPWGWTWIDDAPWGFAPFHYGRWLQLGSRWAWTPGGYADPGYARPGYVEPAYAELVYAPALVTFFGVGAVLGAGLYGGNIGWCPLGPREAYHPWFGASPNYVRRVNVSNVSNVANITNNNVSIRNFRNSAAATQIPAAAMLGSHPVPPIAQAVPGATLASARPLIGPTTLAPSAATSGIMPGLARRFAAPAGAGAVGPGTLGVAAVGAGALGAAAIATARRPSPGPSIPPASSSAAFPPSTRGTSPAPPMHTGVPDGARPFLPGLGAIPPIGARAVPPSAATPPLARPAFGIAPALPQPGLQRPPGVALPVAGSAGAAASIRPSNVAPPGAAAPARVGIPSQSSFQAPGQPSPAAVTRPPAGPAPILQTPSDILHTPPAILNRPMANTPPGGMPPAAPLSRATPPQPVASAPVFRPPPAAPVFHAPPVQQPVFHPPPQAAPAFHAPPQMQPPVFRPPPTGAPVFRAPPPPPSQPVAARPAPPAREPPRDRLHP